MRTVEHGPPLARALSPPCAELNGPAFASRSSQPLNGIMGMLELAKLRSDPDEIKSFIDKAISAGKLLTGLLDDTLDLTRLEHGRATLDIKPISLPALARSCIELVQPLTSLKDIELELRVEDAVASAGECICDARRLTQVLLNLLNKRADRRSNTGLPAGVPSSNPAAPCRLLRSHAHPASQCDQIHARAWHGYSRARNPAVA